MPSAPVLIGLAFLAFFVLIWCKILAKVGHCWAWGLLMLVPGVNLLLLCYLAFAKLPFQRDLDLLRELLTKERLRNERQDNGMSVP